MGPQHTTPRLAVLAAAVVALLTACSSGATAEDPVSATTTAAAATTAVEDETTAPPADTASVAEWAGLVNELSANLDDALASWDDQVCSSMAMDDPLCGAAMLGFSMVTETASIRLGGAADPTSPTYLGEPPAELASLIDETITAAEAAATASEAAVQSCPGTEACVGDAFSGHGAVEDLASLYDRWAPYI